MPRELIVFPDAVAVLVAGLNARLPELGYTGTVAYGRTPDPRPSKPWLLVLRIGGPRQGLVIDNALLSVEAWAATEPLSAKLANDARAVIKALEGTVVAGATVYRAQDITGPALLPHPDTPQQRHTFTVQASLRGHAAN